MNAPKPPAGWYPDPSGEPGQRYFDGNDWTEQRAGSSPPPPPTPNAPKVPPPSAPKQLQRIPLWGWIAIVVVLLVLLVAVPQSCGNKSHQGSSTATTTKSVTASTSGPTLAAPAPTSPASASGHVNEQYFLGDVRADTPGSMDGPWVPWPDDQTLMTQGHGVCTILSAHGGSWAAIEDSPPADLRQYEEGQLHSFIDDTTSDLCYEYSLSHDMGWTPSQRGHPQKTMPPPASIGQEILGETLSFTVTGVSTAKTVQDTTYETKTARGIYVIVMMTVRNNSGTAQQLEGSSQVLRDSAGWQFSAGGKDNNNSSNVLQKGPTGVDIVEPVANLDPDQQMTVGEMFDVPEGMQPSQIVLKEMRPGNNPPLDNPYGMVVNLS
jgi:Protein of unknown function (DUF2510)/Domain of unknown function (DUF4352)